VFSLSIDEILDSPSIGVLVYAGRVEELSWTINFFNLNRSSYINVNEIIRRNQNLVNLLDHHNPDDESQEFSIN